MKHSEGYNKLRGGYYTPEKISEFIVHWAIRSKNDKILEPSCGDGIFLKVATEQLKHMGANENDIWRNVIGIEYDPEEAKKAKQYGAKVICDDFFTYYKDNVDNQKKFDVIVGNPPFIRYQNFAEDFRQNAFLLLKEYGFSPSRLTNIWVPFLLLSCEALKSDGRIGMVIPAELFQVNYAAEARDFLTEFFESLYIITFKKLVFDGIQQEVIILLAEKQSKEKGLRFIELNDLSDLINKGDTCLASSEVKTMMQGEDKWVKYYLTNKELNLLDCLNNDPRISSADQLYETNVGLVSGENEFFVINQARVDEFGLSNDVVPIISRTDQLKGITLSDQDFNSLVKAGKKVYFFDVGNRPFDELSKPAQKYIMWGEERQFDKNYKCKIRPLWYCVPQTWKADAFLVRQANMYPKMILNQKQALVTDTLHKVKFSNHVDGKTVVAAFLNSYTLALSETLGRSYGGGVLTFEPSEMRKIRIPMLYAEELDLEQIDLWQRKGEIKKILEYTDSILLKKGLNLDKNEITTLHNIWNKLRNRRLSRKKR